MSNTRLPYTKRIESKPLLFATEKAWIKNLLKFALQHSFVRDERETETVSNDLVVQHVKKVTFNPLVMVSRDGVTLYFQLDSSCGHAVQQSSFVSNGSTELIGDDVDAGSGRVRQAMEHIQNKISKTRELIRTEQTTRDGESFSCVESFSTV